MNDFLEILWTVILPVTVMLAFVAIVVVGIFLAIGSSDNYFETVDSFIQECIESENYTREECIQLSVRE